MDKMDEHKLNLLEERLFKRLKAYLEWSYEAEIERIKHDCANQALKQIILERNMNELEQKLEGINDD